MRAAARRCRVKAVTGKPILFASTGEKLGDFEKFHPDRMAQRILGMGDVLSFIEKAEQQVDQDEAKELERKLRKNQFTLEDFLDQLKKIRKMGPLTSLLGMIPGLAGHQLSKMNVDERELDRVEAMILSMTPYERKHPELIKGSRRLRIAKGAGVTVQQVNQLVKQFDQMRKLMKGIQQGKMPDLGQIMREVRRRIPAAPPRSSDLTPTRYPAPPIWQSACDSPASAGKKIPSGAWSSRTAAPREMAASLRTSAGTTRRRTRRRLSSTKSGSGTGSPRARSPRSRSRSS